MKAVLTNRFFGFAVLICTTPFFVLPVVDDRVVTGGFAWLEHPLSLGLFAVVLSAFLGLQVRVYRSVLEDGAPQDPVTFQSLGRDSIRLVPVLVVCSGVPALLTIAGDVPPLTLWTVLTPASVSGTLDASAIELVYTAAVLAGAYLFPAAVGVIATDRSIVETTVDGELSSVLWSHDYAGYWLAATVTAVVGLLVLFVWVLIMFALLIFFWPILILLPVGIVLATTIASVVSYLAARGHASAREEFG